MCFISRVGLISSESILLSAVATVSIKLELPDGLIPKFKNHH